MFNSNRQLIKDIQALRPQAAVDPARAVSLRHAFLAEIHQRQATSLASDVAGPSLASDVAGHGSLAKVTWFERFSLAVRLRLAPVAVSSLIGVAGLVLAGGTVAAAAQYASPDGLLYPVKLATEQARLALAFGPTSEAKMHLRFAAERVREIGQLAEQSGGNGQSAIYRVAEQAKLSLAAVQSSLRVAGRQPLVGQSGKDSQTKVAELVQEQAEQAKQQIEQQRDRSQSPEVRAVLGEVEQAAEQTANQALEVLIRQVLAGDVDQAKLSRSALQAKLEGKVALAKQQLASLQQRLLRGDLQALSIAERERYGVALSEAQRKLEAADVAFANGDLTAALRRYLEVMDSLAWAETDLLPLGNQPDKRASLESGAAANGNTNSQGGEVQGAVEVQAVPLIEDNVK